MTIQVSLPRRILRLGHPHPLELATENQSVWTHRRNCLLLSPRSHHRSLTYHLRRLQTRRGLCLCSIRRTRTRQSLSEANLLRPSVFQHEASPSSFYWLKHWSAALVTCNTALSLFRGRLIEPEEVEFVLIFLGSRLFRVFDIGLSQGRQDTLSLDVRVNV